MGDITYQHKDIIRVFPDLSPRSLVSWSEKGILIPGVEDARGRGTVRRYSFDNVVQAGIIRELMALGVTFRIIKNFLGEESRKEIIELNYECVLLIQWKVYKVDNVPDEFKVARHPDVRVISIKDFNDLKASAIFSLILIGEKRGTKRAIPVDENPSIQSALTVNISRIHKYVVRELKSQERG